jgi:3-methyladenine DNA glycosylase Tag
LLSDPGIVRNRAKITAGHRERSLGCRSWSEVRRARSRLSSGRPSPSGRGGR